jgi:hypothetical protein
MSDVLWEGLCHAEFRVGKRYQDGKTESFSELSMMFLEVTVAIEGLVNPCWVGHAQQPTSSMMLRGELLAKSESKSAPFQSCDVFRVRWMLRVPPASDKSSA